MEAQKTSKLGKLTHPNWVLGLMIACSISLVSFEWKFQYADITHDPFEYEIEGGFVEIPQTFQKEVVKDPVREVKFNDQIFKKVDDQTKLDDDKDPFNDFEDPDGDDLFSDGNWWDDDEPEDEVIPWDLVEKMPFIKGCDFEDDSKKRACTLKKIYASLGENIEYPSSLREQGIDGQVIMKFTVDSKGAITDIHPLNDAPKAFLAQSRHGVETLPEFVPAEQMGKAVSVTFTLPISFPQE